MAPASATMTGTTRRAVYVGEKASAGEEPSLNRKAMTVELGPRFDGFRRALAAHTSISVRRTAWRRCEDRSSLCNSASAMDIAPHTLL